MKPAHPLLKERQELEANYLTNPKATRKDLDEYIEVDKQCREQGLLKPLESVIREALAVAREANGDASYRVGDWPGPDKTRADRIAQLGVVADFVMASMTGVPPPGFSELREGTSK